MRPVDKGETPDRTFDDYQDAEPYLEERIGPYCSYCEFPIGHVPEVEHREAKAAGGALLEWNNLLLSCKYCNARKGKIAAKGDKEKYLWPDEDDTFHAFLYDNDIPRLNEQYLQRQGDKARQKADNLFQLIKLDNFPVTPKDKDRRYRKRNEARNYAEDSKAGWDKIKKTQERTDYLHQIEMLAKASGFFSVWMYAFRDDDEVKRILVEAFKGTRADYCLD